MARNFHESYAGETIKPPSERSTGLVFAAVGLLVAILWRNSPTVPWLSLGIALFLSAISLLAPFLLKPLNMLWFRFGLILHRVVNPIVMFAVFAVVFVPAGIIMRLWRDPLRSRRAAGNSTYWIERRKIADTGGTMTNQF